VRKPLPDTGSIRPYKVPKADRLFKRALYRLAIGLYKPAGLQGSARGAPWKGQRGCQGDFEGAL